VYCVPIYGRGVELVLSYEKLIAHIVEAEQRAQTMLQAEERRLADLPQTLETERRLLLDTYLARAQRRIEAAEQSERLAADEEIARLKLRLAADLAATEQHFFEQQETHRRRILAQILGADA